VETQALAGKDQRTLGKSSKLCYNQQLESAGPIPARGGAHSVYGVEYAEAVPPVRDTRSSAR
jgi:hypothetical protein